MTSDCKYPRELMIHIAGMSFTEWLRLLRVRRAKELMRTQEAPIPHLALASGFRDVRTFERTFKRHH